MRRGVIRIIRIIRFIEIGGWGSIGAKVLTLHSGERGEGRSGWERRAMGMMGGVDG